MEFLECLIICISEGLLISLAMSRRKSIKGTVLFRIWATRQENIWWLEGVASQISTSVVDG